MLLSLLAAGCDIPERLARGGLIGSSQPDRPPPPGREAGWRPRATVPARPARPDIEARRTREALLAADHAAAAQPLAPGPARTAPAGAPPRPALRPAPPVPVAAASPVTHPAIPGSAPALLPPQPEAGPPPSALPPPAEPAGPPPPPPRELLAPGR
ncbi:MAG: hypothetical protein NZN45_15075 [Rhodovarius sp.]|nr:hypothetical protein [Rhodovarius sp.]